MEVLDPYWSAYKRLQDIAKNTFTINHRAMALDSALTDLLDAHKSDFCRSSEKDELDIHVAKSMNTSLCRERSRARLRLSHHDDIDIHPAFEQGVIASVALREFRDLMNRPDWELLVAVAEGMTYEELGALGASSNALRTKVSRSRAALKKAA